MGPHTAPFSILEHEFEEFCRLDVDLCILRRSRACDVQCVAVEAGEPQLYRSGRRSLGCREQVNVQPRPFFRLSRDAGEQGAAMESPTRNDQCRIGIYDVQHGPHGRIGRGCFDEVFVTVRNCAVFGRSATWDVSAGRDSRCPGDVKGRSVDTGLAAGDDPGDRKRRFPVYKNYTQIVVGLPCGTNCYTSARSHPQISQKTTQNCFLYYGTVVAVI